MVYVINQGKGACFKVEKYIVRRALTRGFFGENGVPPWIEIVETSPVEAIEALLTVIGELVDDKNLARSLTHPLTRAIEILSNDNPKDDKAAVNMLGAFINKVEAQRGKKISESAADVLIEEAISLQIFLQQ